ncbi:MAG TPA: zinc ribbon domain-containing protein [Chloroflexia bacterium]|jgi:hypothetical protein
MYCKACGKQIDADSIFCKHCGKSQHTEAQLDKAEPSWETAEIFYAQLSKKKAPFFSNSLLYYTGKFWVRGVGPQGEYKVAESDPFGIDEKVREASGGTGTSDGPLPINAEAAQAHRRLIGKLTSAGWEHISSGSGFAWWDDTFRRRIHG